MNFISGLTKRTAYHRLACATALGLAVTGLLSVAVLSGCGGGSKSAGSSSVATGTGRATITIKWPDTTASRLIPVAANSITVYFARDGQTLSTQTIARPSSGSTSTVTFNSLPVGTLEVHAQAHPNADGTGTAQADAGLEVAIKANADTPVTLTMASTISSLSVSPASTSLTVGGNGALSVAGVNAAGEAVLVSTSTLTYSSSNTGVATVSNSGTVTGVAAGTATITVTESESGKNGTATVTVTTATPTPTPTSTPTPSAGTTIVDLANAYIATLSSAQQSATVVGSTVQNAEKWSNLPATPGSSGTTSLRNGVAYSSLTDAQKTAWTNLVNAALSLNSANGLTQESNIRAADTALRTNYNANGYSGDYQYVAFVGTPSTTGNWMLQVGGHHNAHNYYFTGNTIDTSTPYHIATEPTSFTLNGTSYTPLGDQKTAVTNLLSSFSTAQLSSAKLSQNFSDVYLGAGQDARSNFPTGTSGRGILVSSLTSSQQALVKAAINAWVKNSPLASTYQSLYESELASTYVAYAGNSGAPGTVFTAQGDYLRIDGPHVWIEFACQGGIVVQGQIHYHTIWRDRVTDYNAEVAGWTLYNHSN